jgi:hypothetical protein
MSMIPREFPMQKQPPPYLFAELILAGALTQLILAVAGST